MEKTKLPLSTITNQNLNVPLLKTNESESEQSSETNETIVKPIGQLHTSQLKPPGQSTAQSRPKKYLLMKRKESEWEIVEGLKTGHTFDHRPDHYSGFLHKKRKWPLKGWHKRYFVLNNGILTYAKSENDIARGKLHGTIDIGMSVISTKEDGCRLDIDTEEFIYHMKAKTIETFRCWADKLKDHRLYRQHILVYGREPVCDLTRDQVTGVVTRNQSIISTNFTNDLSDISIEQAQADFQQLQNCFRQLTLINSDQDAEYLTKFCRRSTKKSRSRRKQLSLSLSGAVASSTAGSTTTTVSRGLHQYDTITDNKNKGLSGSNTSLTSVSNESNKADAAIFTQKKDEFINVSQKMLEVIKKLLDTFLNERKRMKSICEVEQNGNSNLETIMMLRTSLNKSMKINSELRDQLAQIHQISDLKNLNFDLMPIENYETSSKSSETNTTVFYDAESNISKGTSILASPTAVSMCTAIESPFQLLQQENQHENEEVVTSISNPCYTLVPSTANSESSSIDSLSSEDVENSLSSNDNHSHNSVQGVSLSEHNLNRTSSLSSQQRHHSRSEIQERDQQLNDEIQQSDLKIVPKHQQVVGRRTKLPVPKSDTGGFPLWNVLYKNIGKDLTQISMPVHLNEPLNTLQKLCEELEYSELIKKASECESVTEQMVYVAAFAVSAYTNSLYRTASKPFNPLLGETYECVRDDKGFKFLAEQVSHHPAISACHAESDSFEFWQDIRIKSKFWGKSMEIQPIGFVNLYLKKTRSHYRWNKVTTCIHNLFNNSKRWVDQYGELTICNQSQNVSCRLTFEKASYWSSKKHEFYGDIIDTDGTVVRKLFGRWSEAVYCDTESKCVWRPNPMPDNFEKYFGFSQFAIELNELNDNLRTLLPCTDTRFRPDQRALEEGRVDEADDLKSLLESKQRERRKENERLHIEHKPRWFLRDYTKNNEEFWKFSGKYWQYRENRNFSSLEIEPLW